MKNSVSISATWLYVLINFKDDVFKCMFFNVKVCIQVTKILLKYVAMYPTDSINLDNGLVPFRRQDIIWTYIDIFRRIHMRQPAWLS